VERLETAVQAQAARAMRAAARFYDSDGSEAMKAILVREEQKLRDLRRKLAEASPTETKQPTLDYRRAAKAFEDIATLVKVKPHEARARLSRFLTPSS
jgi:hypothetical protein